MSFVGRSNFSNSSSSGSSSSSSSNITRLPKISFSPNLRISRAPHQVPHHSLGLNSQPFTPLAQWGALHLSLWTLIPAGWWCHTWTPEWCRDVPHPWTTTLPACILLVSKKNQQQINCEYFTNVLLSRDDRSFVF